MNELEGKIEAYLEGSLSKKAAMAFEEEIAKNEDLAKQIELKRDILEFFNNRNPELDKQLNDLGEEFFKEPVSQKFTLNNKLVGLGLLLVAALAILFYLISNKEIQDVETPVLQDKIINPQQKIENDIEEVMPSIKEAKEAKEEKIEKQILVPEKENKKEELIFAQVDKYEENKILEELVRENIRSGKVDFNIKEAPNEVLRSQANNKINFYISGFLTKNEAVVVNIYDNQADHFNKDIKVFSKELLPKKQSEEAFYIKLNANIPFEKGLYYYILQTKDTGNILHIAKFKVI